MSGWAQAISSPRGAPDDCIIGARSLFVERDQTRAAQACSCGTATLRATPSLTGSGPWPLVTRKEPLARIVAAALPRGEDGSGRGCR